MIEILTMGNVENDFKRVGVKVRQTYIGEEYGVCEVTEDEFKTLCNDEADGWVDCGWRYAKGSNQQDPDEKVLINGKEIIAWYDAFKVFDSEEEKQDYSKEHNGIMLLEKFSNLLEYLCNEMGCSQPRNVCALTVHLAKANNMKLSELFKKYQG